MPGFPTPDARPEVLTLREALGGSNTNGEKHGRGSKPVGKVFKTVALLAELARVARAGTVLASTFHGADEVRCRLRDAEVRSGPRGRAHAWSCDTWCRADRGGLGGALRGRLQLYGS